MSIFAHIVEAGSVSAAADKLDLSKSVISQHLKALEGDLGVTLIKRTTRRQVLTETGEQFYVHCKDINIIANTAWDKVQEQHTVPSGRIRITAPNALMDLLITPVVADLMKKYPKLKPELISDDQHIDLIAKDIDLAIRIGKSKNSNLVQKRIGEFEDVLCGTQALKGQSLEQLPYIANAWQGKRIQHEFRTSAGTSFSYQTEASCMTNSLQSCLSLIQSGVGIGIIPDFYFPQVQPNVVSLLPDMSLPTNTIYALNPFGTRKPLAVQLCIEALEERLKAKIG